jgi:acetyl-CoA/propionyl-CoA carboxylase biotin carboxyl carrier protein
VKVAGPPFAGAAALASNGVASAGASKPRRGTDQRSASKSAAAGGPDTLPSPLQGNMWKVLVKQGDTVAEGQLLCIIEAMKMENEITAHKAGVIVELPIAEGAPIAAGAPIATIKSA